MFDNFVSLSSPNFDTVINCSCEHMYQCLNLENY